KARSILGQEAIHGHPVADLERIPGPAASHQAGRRPELDFPIDQLTLAAILYINSYINEKPGVRIDPIDFCHQTRQLHRFRPVVLRCEGMVSRDWNSGRCQSKAGSENECTPFFHWASKPPSIYHPRSAGRPYLDR